MAGGLRIDLGRRSGTCAVIDDVLTTGGRRPRVLGARGGRTRRERGAHGREGGPARLPARYTRLGYVGSVVAWEAPRSRCQPQRRKDPLRDPGRGAWRGLEVSPATEALAQAGRRREVLLGSGDPRQASVGSKTRVADGARPSRTGGGSRGLHRCRGRRSWTSAQGRGHRVTDKERRAAERKSPGRRVNPRAADASPIIAEKACGPPRREHRKP